VVLAYNKNTVLLRVLAACGVTALAWGQTALQQAERAFDAGNYAEAARLFGAAHQQSPRCDILFFLGMAQYRMKKVDAALISFQSAVQCDPKLTFAYLGLGEAYAERGSDKEALAAYLAALKLEPKNKDALRGAGALYLRGKLFDRAVEVIQVLVSLEPANAQAHADLGAAYLGTGNQDQAEAQFQDALRIQPNHASALLGLANIDLRKGREDEAVAALRKLVTLVPKAYEPHYLLGTAYNRQSHYQDALTELQAALRLGGNESEIYYHLARAYGGLERPDDRRAALAKFAELSRKSKADAAGQREAAQLVEQAKTLVDAGDVNTAALRLETARELRQSDATILFRLASLYYDLQRLQPARDYAQEAVSLAPSEWLYHYLLGLIEKSDRHWPQARSSLETAAELKPSAAEVHNALGQVALEQGDNRHAMAYFQRAVKLDPKQPSYRENLKAAEAAGQLKR
jgi:protein O-GlcNAc transferase